MLIEVHLAPEEDLAGVEPVKSCDNKSCVLGSAAEVFVFVNRSHASHLRRLHQARMREQRDSARERHRVEQNAALAGIRRAWDRLGYHHFGL